MVSDGMSPGVLHPGRGLFPTHPQARHRAGGDLFNDPAAARGLMDTASANSLVTDSAAASSAWGGGQRVNNGAINISPEGKEITADRRDPEKIRARHPHRPGDHRHRHPRHARRLRRIRRRKGG